MKKYFYKNNRDLENRFRLFFWGVPCGARREWAIRAFAQAAVRGFYATEQGCNPTKMKAEGIQVFIIKSELPGVGIMMVQTSFGHTVPVYDMERISLSEYRDKFSLYEEMREYFAIKES